MWIVEAVEREDERDSAISAMIHEDISNAPYLAQRYGIGKEHMRNILRKPRTDIPIMIPANIDKPIELRTPSRIVWDNLVDVFRW